MLNVFGNKKKSPNLRDMLPATHSFVTFVVRGNGPQGRVCFEDASIKTFRTTKLAGMIAGQVGVFTYENGIGKFTFAARLASLSDGQAVFAMPDDIKTLSRTNEKERRVEPRIDTTVNAEWRFKPVGKLVSNWTKVIVSDLSRNSANMTADRDLKPNELIEVRMTLEGKVPIVIEAGVVRGERSGPKYRIALAFKHVDVESSHVITRFINKRMTELRSRGLS